MSRAESRVTIHYDDLVAEHPPPVLLIKKQPRAATPDTATKVWRYPSSVLAIAETFMQTARDLEAHMEEIFETCKSSSEDETRKAMVKIVKEELRMRWNKAAEEANEVIRTEMKDMTPEQKEELREYLSHMIDFCEKLAEWVYLIIDKAMDEVIKGHNLAPSIASRIVGAVIKAYDQVFMHDLLEFMSP